MRWRRVGALAISLTAAIALSIGTGAGAQASHEGDPDSDVNNNPDFVQVYVNNVENRPKATWSACRGDHKDLIYYMKSREYSPDLFIVQQVANAGQLANLTDFMTEKLDGVYTGIIAIANPRVDIPNKCGGHKKTQTNAVIYRIGRFDDMGVKHIWQSHADRDDNKTCGPDELNDQDRTRNLAVRLWDEWASRPVTVASIHWPSYARRGWPCAEQNVEDMEGQLTQYLGSNSRIVGGDFNIAHGEGGQGWYEQMNRDLGGTYGYEDAIYNDCQERSGPVEGCLSDNWTFNPDNNPPRRIDFLFARGPAWPSPTDTTSFGAEATVTFHDAGVADDRWTHGDDPGLDYSEHRAIIARVTYGVG